MANICTWQQQILIILTWTVKAITKVLKKAMKFFGTLIFFSGLAYYLHRTSGFLATLLTFTKTQKPKVLFLSISTIISAKISTSDTSFIYFQKNIFVTFSRHGKNEAEEDSSIKFRQLEFSGVK